MQPTDPVQEDPLERADQGQRAPGEPALGAPTSAPSGGRLAWVRWVTTLAALAVLALGASTRIGGRRQSPGQAGDPSGLGPGLFLTENPVLGTVAWRPAENAVSYGIRVWATAPGSAKPTGPPLWAEEDIQALTWSLPRSMLPSRGGLYFELECVGGNQGIDPGGTFVQQP